MNKEEIRNLDEIIKEIENCEYIDCHKDEIFDDYQYENILYYLKQLKKQKEINQKAIEYIKSNSDIYRSITGDEVGFFRRHYDGHVPVELLEILEDKEVKE